MSMSPGRSATPVVAADRAPTLTSANDQPLDDLLVGDLARRDPGLRGLFREERLDVGIGDRLAALPTLLS